MLLSFEKTSSLFKKKISIRVYEASPKLKIPILYLYWQQDWKYFQSIYFAISKNLKKGEKVVSQQQQWQQKLEKLEARCSSLKKGPILNQCIVVLYAKAIRTISLFHTSGNFHFFATLPIQGLFKDGQESWKKYSNFFL